MAGAEKVAWFTMIEMGTYLNASHTADAIMGLSPSLERRSRKRVRQEGDSAAKRKRLKSSAQA